MVITLEIESTFKGIDLTVTCSYYSLHYLNNDCCIVIASSGIQENQSRIE